MRALKFPIDPHRQECVEVLKEGAVVSQKKVQKHFTWMVEKGAELDEAELKKMRKLEKAGIKVLPAAVRYNRSAVAMIIYIFSMRLTKTACVKDAGNHQMLVLS